MGKLQAAIEQAFAVLPQPPVVVLPSKAVLGHPALGNQRKLVQFAALGDPSRDFLAQRLAHPLREKLSHLAAVAQHTLHRSQASLTLATLERLQHPFAISTSALVTATAWGKPCCIDCNVALDARDFLARVIGFERRRIRTLDDLRVHDQERREGAAPQFFKGRANLIFLNPAPKR